LAYVVKNVRLRGWCTRLSFGAFWRTQIAALYMPLSPPPLANAFHLKVGAAWPTLTSILQCDVGDASTVLQDLVEHFPPSSPSVKGGTKRQQHCDAVLWPLPEQTSPVAEGGQLRAVCQWHSIARSHVSRPQPL
jgi:hypothetical protein